MTCKIDILIEGSAKETMRTPSSEMLKKRHVGILLRSGRSMAWRIEVASTFRTGV